MTNLKACPFCGAEEMGVEQDPLWGHQIECDQCHARGPAVLEDNPDRVESLWNQRVPFNPSTGKPYFVIGQEQWSDELLEAWETGFLRDDNGKAIARVDYEAEGLVPITDRETATRSGSERSGE